ncbi:carbohydrate porin [Acetobacteraceae bacterium KSS8]|uniref:Carbohydrate porin n=1 Tax=Endosaccharibacter trunci TaxID=2812733 RepID=A0ABT1W2X9_9PROT|nr:carbohydrate porin [Acetobacteraceae bacterium KSS8]
MTKTIATSRRPMARAVAMLSALATIGAQQTAFAAGDPPAATDLWQSPTLFGDMGGLRPVLAGRGVSLGVNETDEVLGNPSGGLRRAAAFDGFTQLGLGVDTSAFGWPGGVFNVSALQIHGRDLGSEDLDVLELPSSIEAERATRLWELWFQQTIGRADVKLGLQSIDQEFLTSQNASVFMNATMGWPVLPSEDLHAGGPAYPLSSLGIRLRFRPTDTVTVLGGVFDDDPVGGDFANDGQTLGAAQSGTSFDLGGGALFMAELQFGVNFAPKASAAPSQQGSPVPSADVAPTDPGSPGTYKIGGWYDSGAFPDQRLGVGSAQAHRTNLGLYAVADQTVWHRGARTIGVFARLMGAPQQDRNLVVFASQGGVTMKAPFAARPNDTVGLGAGIARLGHQAVLFQRAEAAAGFDVAVRSAEAMLELTYQAQIAPWWVVQPDLQYLVDPAGSAALVGAVAGGRRSGSALVLGLRTSVAF